MNIMNTNTAIALVGISITVGRVFRVGHADMPSMDIFTK